MTKLIEDIIAGYLASDDCDTYASDNLLREAEAELRRLRGAVWKASDRLHAYENASADFVDFRVAGAIADLDGALDGEP